VPYTFRPVGYLFVIWSLPAARHTMDTWTQHLPSTERQATSCMYRQPALATSPGLLTAPPTGCPVWAIMFYTWYLCSFVAADRLVGLYHSRAGLLLALLYSAITTLHDHDLEPDSCQDPSSV
jgi:hypothetical protein